MIRKALAVFAAAALWTLGCSDDPSPTQPNPIQPTPNVLPTPTPTPGPDPSRAPVVTSAERTTFYYPTDRGWIIRGSNFIPDPVATFESAGSVIHLSVEENTFRGELVGVTVPRNTPPGPYTPCVATVNGKGCGSFVVTVE